MLNDEQKSNIKICGRYLYQTLMEVRSSIKPGVSARVLDEIAERVLLKFGCRPSFKNYYVAGAGSYPASICVSVNDEVVHGLPLDKKVFQEGDIVGLDLGAEYKGINTDMAITVPVGQVSADASKLIKATEDGLMAGISAIKPGAKIGDIGHAIEQVAKQYSLGVVKEYVGHGIGVRPHQPPQIPNFGREGTGSPIVDSTAIAIEPMFTLGDYRTYVDNDGWTVHTVDHSFTAHFEHTVLVENGEPVIVTAA